MDAFWSIAERAERTAEWWVWNQIVHSWVDPIFITLLFVGVGYLFYWLLTRSDS